MQSAFRMATRNEKVVKGHPNESLASESLDLRLTESEGEGDKVGEKAPPKPTEVSASDESDPGEGTSTAAATALYSVKSPLMATSDNEDVIDSMETAAEDDGVLTFRVNTASDGMMLVKTPGKLSQASHFVCYPFHKSEIHHST